jgi:hypothetical protein
VGGGSGGTYQSFIQGESQNESCFLVNSAREWKLLVVERHPEKATSPPTPTTESIACGSFLSWLWSPSSSPWLLEKLGGCFNRREFVLF